MDDLSLENLDMQGPSLLGRFLGQSWMMEASAGELFVNHQEFGRQRVPLDSNATSLLPKAIGYQLTFPGGSSEITVDNIPSPLAQRLYKVLTAARTKRGLKLIKSLDAQLDEAWIEFCQAHGIDQKRYIRKNVFENALPGFLREQDTTMALMRDTCKSVNMIKALPKAANRIARLQEDSESVRTNLNEKRLRENFEDCSGIFQKAGLELTQEQAAAALSMERANLLEAGAGSGKTVVIVARALYAVYQGIAKPEEILCLAYNTAAAAEIKERLISAFERAGVAGGGNIYVSTFHSLGLAIVRACAEHPVRVVGDTNNRDNEKIMADMFDQALRQTLQNSKHRDVYTQLVEDIINHDWRFKKQATKSAFRKSPERILRERLLGAEGAFHVSRVKARDSDADQELLEYRQTWGLSESRARSLLGYAGFIRSLNHYFRSLMRSSHLVDFADMTVRACEIIKDFSQGKRPDLRDIPELKLKFLMVDEFQDISFDRAELVKQLSTLHANSIVFGVGDDWQAINRFSGSDITLFTEFEGFFGDTERRQLTATFRSCRGIAGAARDFIVQNPLQSQKGINRVLNEQIEDAIRVVEYPAKSGVEAAIIKTINEWLKTSDVTVPTIMVLDRNSLSKSRALSPAAFKRIQVEFGEQAEIAFHTAHASKGLEADFVIVTGLIAGIFPNTRPKDYWTDLFMPREEVSIENADERRLFYVALTRAKKAVALLAPDTAPSTFVGEISRIYQTFRKRES